MYLYISIHVFIFFQHAENEKNLQMLRNKIETDIANVRTLFESYKNDVFRYSIGMFTEIMCIENKFQQACAILLCLNSFALMSFYMYWHLSLCQYVYVHVD